MFSLSHFIKTGLLKAIGRLPDYSIILQAASWHDKGVLNETDLIEIQTAIDERNELISSIGNEVL